MTGHAQDLWTSIGPNGRRVRNDRYGKGKRWQARWLDADGYERAKAFESKEAALAHVARMVVNPDRPRPKVTFGDYYETWRKSRLNFRDNSARNVEVAYRRTIRPTLGNLPIAGITRMDVQNAVIEWQTKHQPSTVHVFYGYVATVFKHAILDGLITQTPCRKISLPPRPKERIVPLTVDQVKAIRDAMPEPYRAAVTLAAATGMRIGELGGLTYDHIVGRTIIVDRQLTGSGPTFGPTKSPASNRDIPLGTVAYAALQAHIEKYPDNPAGLVFTAPRGGPLTRHAASRMWRDATEGMDLPGKHGWHSLRHHSASLLIAAGLSPRAVADRLGHANPNVTMAVYSHLWGDDQERANRAIDDALG